MIVTLYTRLTRLDLLPIRSSRRTTFGMRSSRERATSSNAQGTREKLSRAFALKMFTTKPQHRKKFSSLSISLGCMKIPEISLGTVFLTHFLSTTLYIGGGKTIGKLTCLIIPRLSSTSCYARHNEPHHAP